MCDKCQEMITIGRQRRRQRMGERERTEGREYGKKLKIFKHLIVWLLLAIKQKRATERECKRVTRIEREVEGDRERERGTARKRTIETRACDSVEWICILPCRFGKRLIIKHIMGDSILYNTQGCTYLQIHVYLYVCLSVSLCVCVFLSLCDLWVLLLFGSPRFVVLFCSRFKIFSTIVVCLFEHLF